MKYQRKVDVLVGLQWGDEGKGKIVDVLSTRYKIIARFQGGPNAGHTLEFDNKKYVLHTVPSGIFHKDCINIIGNGVVIDPVIFYKEFSRLDLSVKEFNDRLLLSQKAHLIMPSHRLMDAALEHSKGAAKIGSTLKGIGPAYTDKIARNGLRLGNLLQDNFKEKYNQLKGHHLNLIKSLNFDYAGVKLDGDDFEAYEKKWFEGVEFIKNLVLAESEIFINDALKNGSSILAEGAQGSLLDVDFGSYPFVTSSNTITAGACTGLGVAPSAIGEVYGLFKAYCTRVGSGPFPTELTEETGEKLRTVGREFGATTGRPRRCGWLDLPALKYSIMLNGVTQLIMTKADVLDSFEGFKVCVAYEYKGKKIDYIPFDYDPANLKPIYTTLKGWNCCLETYQSFDSLPPELSTYVKYIEDSVNVPVTIISTGPDRLQTIIRN